jgi:phosphopantetheinyl transferase
VLLNKQINSLEIILSFSTQSPAFLSSKEQKQSNLLFGLPRYKSWLYGRSALKNLLSNLNLDMDTSRLTFPNSRFSLSHCVNLAVAAGLLTEQKSIDGVGVDLELNRSVTDMHTKFYLSRIERRSALDNDDRIRLWTIKEALFKADPDNQYTVLGHYEIEDPSLLQGKAKNHRGRSFYYSCEKLPMDKIFEIRSGGWISCAVSFSAST